MTNRQWLMNEMQNMSDEEFATRVVLPEEVFCGICLGNCNACVNAECVVNWLKSEHKEIPKLSDAERVILENIDKKYFNYIARNKNGSLYLYFSKPNKNNDAGIWKELSYMHCEGFYMFKNLFQFITWNDSEPYNIEELLKCGH